MGARIVDLLAGTLDVLSGQILVAVTTTLRECRHYSLKTSGVVKRAPISFDISESASEAGKLPLDAVDVSCNGTAPARPRRGQSTRQLLCRNRWVQRALLTLQRTLDSNEWRRSPLRVATLDLSERRFPAVRRTT
jgi:hypothetical protein